MTTEPRTAKGRKDEDQESKAPVTPKPASRKRWIGLAVVALCAVLGAKALAGLSKRGAGGLPPPIVVDVATAPRLSAPPPVGSPEETAEIDELLALQAKRGDAEAKEAAFWQAGAVLRWNEITVGLIIQYGTAPVVASRLLALVSVAQHDALIVALTEQRAHKRAAPGKVTPLFAAKTESSYPSEHAAIAAASVAVLRYVYGSKEQFDWLAKRAREHTDSRLAAGVSRPSDITAGEQIGRQAAEKVIARAKGDGSDRAHLNSPGTIPQGDDKWKSSEHPAVPPLRAGWGAVQPWLMRSGDQFRSPPPPALDSPEFAAAIEEARQNARTRTPEQLALAKHWSDAQGSPTPAGHWNKAGEELVAHHPMSELAAARVFAFMNMATMDAGIGCWDAKYKYWYLRPAQADPTITLPIGLPNFPSYPSGHSCFSGAAAEVLSHFFPDAREQMTKMATEAAMSRFYGGIHYRFECDRGLKLGRHVAALAIDKLKAELPAP